LRRMDIRDLLILSALTEGGHVNRLTGMTIYDIRLDRKYDAVYRRMLHLERAGFVARGFANAKSDTYYITQKGIDFIKEAVL